MRGGKTTVFEGGQRVRAFIYGGRNLGVNPFEYNGIFHSVDIVPTLMSAAIGDSIGILGLKLSKNQINLKKVLFFLISNAKFGRNKRN